MPQPADGTACFSLLSLKSTALNVNRVRRGPFLLLPSSVQLYKCHTFIVLVKGTFYKFTIKAFLYARVFFGPLCDSEFLKVR